MKFKNALAAMTIFAVVSAARAQEMAATGDADALTIGGNTTCVTYLENPGQYSDWVFGYWSGANAAKHVNVGNEFARPLNNMLNAVLLTCQGDKALTLQQAVSVNWISAWKAGK